MAQPNEPKTKGNLTVSFFVFCSYHRQRINKNTIIVSLRSYHSYPALGIPLYCWLMSQVLCDQGKCKKKKSADVLQGCSGCSLCKVFRLNQTCKKNPTAKLINVKKKKAAVQQHQVVGGFLCALPPNLLYLMQILCCDLSDQVQNDFHWLVLLLLIKIIQ